MDAVTDERASEAPHVSAGEVGVCEEEVEVGRGVCLGVYFCEDDFVLVAPFEGVCDCF